MYVHKYIYIYIHICIAYTRYSMLYNMICITCYYHVSYCAILRHMI